jgi:hypothetical protein
MGFLRIKRARLAYHTTLGILYEAEEKIDEAYKLIDTAYMKVRNNEFEPADIGKENLTSPGRLLSNMHPRDMNLRVTRLRIHAWQCSMK